MRKILVFNFLFLIVISCFSQDIEESGEQDDSVVSSSSKQYKRILSFHPLAFFSNTFLSGIEFRIGQTASSIRFGAGINYSENPGNRFWPLSYYYANRMVGYQLELQPRFYVNPSQEALNGFYFGPYASYRFISMTVDYFFYGPRPSDVRQNHIFSGGLMFGYQKIVGERLSLDASVGGGYFHTRGEYSERDYSIFDPFGTGLRPRVSIGAGYLF